MLLVMDIGNSNIVMGLYEGETLRHHWRVATDRNKTEDEYGMLVRSLCDSVGLTLDSVDGVIISSVVPPINVMMERMCEKYLRHKPLIVGPGIKTGLNIKYEYPREVGTDRIVNAVAAIHEYGTPLIVVDFGTATTFCAVNSKRDYLGGVICPGMKISAEALFEKASKLPRIEILKPKHVIGRNVVTSMQSGIVHGYVGQVDHIVSLMKQEIGEEGVKVVATGGMARLIASESRTIDEVNPFLTLEGLQVIYELNYPG